MQYIRNITVESDYKGHLGTRVIWPLYADEPYKRTNLSNKGPIGDFEFDTFMQLTLISGDRDPYKRTLLYFLQWSPLIVVTGFNGHLLKVVNFKSPKWTFSTQSCPVIVVVRI